MKFFYLSSVPNSENLFEVHDKECEMIPDSINRDYLGPFNNGKEALRKAIQLKSESTLCPKCCIGAPQPIIFSERSKERTDTN